MKRLQLPTASCVWLALLASGAFPAAAGTLRIACEDEDVVVAGWDAPMEVIYSGDASGTLTVESEHVALSLPASKSVRTGTHDGKPYSVTGITAGGETTAAMPDLAALDACVGKSMRPEFAGDADMYAVSTMSCLAKIPPGAAPVSIKASVTIALVPNEAAGPPDVNVEIKRTYAAKSGSPSGTSSIEMFPKDCTLQQ